MAKENFTFRLDGDLRQAVTKIASAEDRSVAQIIIRFIKEGLKSADKLRRAK